MTDNKTYRTDLFLLSLVGLLVLSKIMLTKAIGCPVSFDCNSYIAMVGDLSPGDHALSHHAMRVLPIFMVRALMLLGFSMDAGFHIVSGGALMLFSLGVYAFIRYFTKSSVWAFAWSLLLVTLHSAMRVPLDIIYQANDALVYPLGLAMLAAAHANRVGLTFVLAILGVLTRQNLFVLSFFSMSSLALNNRDIRALIGTGVVFCSYFVLQKFYGANGSILNHFTPQGDFFSLSHQWSILVESQFLELWIVFAPFLLTSGKQLFKFFKDNWHWPMYTAVVVAQPYLAYHMTGNNFARIALQGVWVIALAVAINHRLPYRLSRAQAALLVTYAGAVFVTWGAQQRVVLATVYLLAYFIIDKYEQRAATASLA